MCILFSLFNKPFMPVKITEDNKSILATLKSNPLLFLGRELLKKSEYEISIITDPEELPRIGLPVLMVSNLKNNCCAIVYECDKELGLSLYRDKSQMRSTVYSSKYPLRGADTEKLRWEIQGWILYQRYCRN